MLEHVDRDLDKYIAQTIMGDLGRRSYTSSMAGGLASGGAPDLKMSRGAEAGHVPRGHREHWVASFYSPSRCARYEGRGPTAALAVCRAAKETFTNLTD